MPPLKYKPEFCQGLIEHMSEGLSFETYAAKINVTYAVLYRWRKKYPEFRLAYELGHAHYRMSWELLGNQGSRGQIKGFNFAAWYKNMINRFGWSDKTVIIEENGNKDVPELTDNELAYKISEALEVIAKYELERSQEDSAGSGTQEAEVVDALPSA